MSEDRFFERLREDARQLRYEPQDEAMWTRLAAKIRAQVAQPTVAQLLAMWFRPVAASLTAIAVAAVIGISLADAPAATELAASDPVEISIAGGDYVVGE